MLCLNSIGVRSNAKYLTAVAALTLFTTGSIWLNLPRNRKNKYELAQIDAFSTSSNVKHPVVIYNRIPKTGSTSFLRVTYKLTLKNQFTAYYMLLDSEHHSWSSHDALSWISNISASRQKYPVFYHGHFPFISLQKHGLDGSVFFINVIRNPLERFVSYYYFLRYGDDFRPNHKRKRAGDTTSFDDCVIEQKLPECKPSSLWLQIPFFCGSEPLCWKPGNDWALQTAKRNLVDKYLVVGVSEQMGNFVRLIEHLLPTYFRGAQNIYFDSKGNELHVRNTKKKFQYNDATLKYFQANPIWQKENEFYQFAKRIFESTFAQTFESESGILRKPKFKFMKVVGPV